MRSTSSSTSAGMHASDIWAAAGLPAAHDAHASSHRPTDYVYPIHTSRLHQCSPACGMGTCVPDSSAAPHQAPAPIRSTGLLAAAAGATTACSSDPCASTSCVNCLAVQRPTCCVQQVEHLLRPDVIILKHTAADTNTALQLRRACIHHGWCHNSPPPISQHLLQPCCGTVATTS